MKRTQLTELDIAGAAPRLRQCVLFADLDQEQFDGVIKHTRRVVLQEKVHFMVGPLCGHEGPAVAQVSKETGVPLVMDAAGADNVTKWDRTPTVVRTAVSSSQIGHPWGEYLYKELGLRNVTFIAQDYTFGHEITLGAVRTFTALGGKVAKIVWNPVGTKDYGATIAGIPPDTDGVSAQVVGVDRLRLYEAWFNFGMDKKHKIYGGYWMHQDVLPQMDERALGLIGNSLHYAAGLDTPENKAFTEAFARKYKRLPSSFHADIVKDATLQANKRVTDISMGGCTVETAETLPQGTYLELTIRPVSNQADITVETARVSSVRPEGMGIQFLDFKPEEKRRLSRVVLSLLVGQGVQPVPYSS